MKKLLTALSLAALLAGSVAFAQEAAKPGAEVLKTQKDKASYAIGQDIGQNLKRGMIDIDPAMLSRGLADALEGKSLMTDEQMMEAMTNLQKELMEKHQNEAVENQKRGAAFLEENKKKPGVKTTASGLQYQITQEGTGASPKPEDIVRVHYRGTLLDGTEFDSSYKRNEPAAFQLNQVIRGWTEGLQLMKTGGKATFWIPANLAYGEQGMPGAIPPNSTLKFEVELLSIEKAPAQEGARTPTR